MENLLIIYQYLLAILGFSLIIIVHELGHFVMAKLSGMHVEEFFIGFGPKLLKHKSKKTGTTYGISAIPVGGYNKILGMDRSEEVPEKLKEKSFYSKPGYKKFLVIIGGVVFNILFAMLLIAIFLSMGVYEPINVVESVQPGSPAEEAGLRAGDKVIALDGKEINSWNEFSKLTKNSPEEKVTYVIERDGQKKEVNAQLEEKDGENFLGIYPKAEKEYLSFPEIVKNTFVYTWDAIKTYGLLLGMLFGGKLSFAQARPVSPVGIINIFQQTAQMGMQNLIVFTALVSLLISFGNLLPLLPLDGGHLVVLAIESIRKKPIPKKVLEIVTTAGIFIMVSLLIIGFVYDIISPFNLQNM
ncbi:MAG: M50 family metallopeptidase [Candidatus Humimicrobiaceae bacterium]